ncbi:MAG: NACHT domain-containing NTPase [Roseimicrobium sp.]
MQQLIRQALKDKNAPLPILANLTQFDWVKAQSKAGRLQRLMRRTLVDDAGAAVELLSTKEFILQLVMQIGRRGGAPRRRLVHFLLHHSKVTLLLDGLDEVNDAHHARMALALKNGFLHDYRHIPIVIASRVLDYQRLRDDSELSLPLPGVVLEPLKEPQIHAYLKTMGAEELVHALATDENLREMAHSPLTLCMMTLAYGDMKPEEIEEPGSTLAQRRRHLMDSYVTRMMQREACKRKGKDYHAAGKEVLPTPYSWAQLNRQLGWLAVRLSERMKTDFPLHRVSEFFRENKPAAFLLPVGGSSMLDRIRDAGRWVLVLMVMSIHAAALSFGAHVTAGHALQNILCTVAGSGLGLWVLPIWREERSVGKAYACTAMLLAGLLFGCTLGFVLSLVHGVAGLRMPTAWFAVVLFFFLVALSPWLDALSSYKVHDKPGAKSRLRQLRGLLSISTLGGLCCSAVVVIGARYIETAELHGRLLVYGLLVLCVALVVCLKEWSKHWHWHWLVQAAILAIYSSVAFAFVGLVAWTRSHLPLGATLFFISFIAGWIGTAEVMAAALFLVAPVSLAVYFYIGLDAGSLAFIAAVVAVSILYSKESPALRVVEWLVLNPCLKFSLAVSGAVPFRWKRQLDYACATLLLKRSSGYYVFMHRLLRDHFATRELVSALEVAQSAQRHELIGKLSLQGESSFEILKDLAGSSDMDTRASAISAVGRLTLPAALEFLALRLETEPAPLVRTVLVQSLGKFHYYERLRLLRKAAGDTSPDVRSAVFGALPACKDGQCLIIGEGILYLALRGMLDPSPDVQMAAIRTIAEHRSDKVYFQEFRSEDIPIRLLSALVAHSCSPKESEIVSLALFRIVQEVLPLKEDGDSEHDAPPHRDTLEKMTLDTVKNLCGHLRTKNGEDPSVPLQSLVKAVSHARSDPAFPRVLGRLLDILEREDIDWHRDETLTLGTDLGQMLVDASRSGVNISSATERLNTWLRHDDWIKEYAAVVILLTMKPLKERQAAADLMLKYSEGDEDFLSKRNARFRDAVKSVSERLERFPGS